MGELSSLIPTKIRLRIEQLFYEEEPSVIPRFKAPRLVILFITFQF